MIIISAIVLPIWAKSEEIVVIPIPHLFYSKYNRLHHLGQGRMSDLAGVYSLGIAEGTVVSHNLMYVKETPRHSVHLAFLDFLSGSPLEGLELLLTDSSCVTDSRGMIRIPELLEGNHTLELPDKPNGLIDE